MIELRWLIRKVPHPDIVDLVPMNVLQYREGDYPYIDRGTDKESDEWRGTEWRDVPTVMDDSAPSEQEGK